MQQFKEQYFQIWQDAWSFHKMFANVTDEAEWDRLIDYHNELCLKYPGNKFASDLFLVVIGELQRKQTAKWQVERINNNL